MVQEPEEEIPQETVPQEIPTPPPVVVVVKTKPTFLPGGIAEINTVGETTCCAFSCNNIPRNINDP